MEILALILFVSIFFTILKGYPVSFTLGGLSILFAIACSIFAPDFVDMRDMRLLANRIFGVVNNYVLMAVPLFIFMGIMLEKSGIAEGLLDTMAVLFGKIKGGLAVSVIVVGALLAASTGIVGATVVTMGLISLPTLLKRGYSVSLATGTIAASGTLGVIIPPSILLVLLADTINSSNRGGSPVDVGLMFKAALLPGLFLVFCYIVYVLIKARIHPQDAPVLSDEEIAAFKDDKFVSKMIQAFVLPLLLIVLVLGSIFAGIASPTEAAAVGAMGAILLTFVKKKLSIKILQDVGIQTVHLTSMVFFILLGATTFAFLFRLLGGDDLLVELVNNANLSPYVFLIIVMIILFIAGFFIDFIEIIFIMVPVVTPLFNAFGLDMLWVGVLIAMNLQTSFLTPPFGFSLFYLKGVAPPEVKTKDIYKGIVPFIAIQAGVIALIIIFPDLIRII
jgi:tripartite ATP-independent transporter DctM subunit